MRHRKRRPLGRLGVHDREIADLHFEQTTFTELVVERCRVARVSLLGASVRAGRATDTDFVACSFSASAIPMTFSSCTFRNCNLDGISGALFEKCTFRRCRMFGSLGVRVRGGKFLQTTYDDAIAFSGDEDVEASRLVERARETPRDKRLYYDDERAPEYRSVGELMEKRGVPVGVRRYAWRELFAARERLAWVSEDVRLRLRKKLERGDLGYGRPSADVLKLLVAIDRVGKGLVWPEVGWLAEQLNRDQKDVRTSIDRLKARGVVAVLEVPIFAVWINYAQLTV